MRRDSEAAVRAEGQRSGPGERKLIVLNPCGSRIAPDAETSIRRHRDNARTVPRGCHGAHWTSVAFQGTNWIASRRVPKAHGAVFRGRHDDATVVCQCDVMNRARMSTQHTELRPGSKVDDPDVILI